MAGQGASVGFSGAEFRENIRFAMQMGAPTATQEKVTFCWNREKTYDPQDHRRRPYDFTQPTVTDEPGNEDIPSGSTTVDCAVEFLPRNTSGTENQVGNFSAPRIIVTLLDEEYATIEGFDYAMIDGSTYNPEYTAPPLGLFEVTVYQIHLTAADEA